MAASLNLVPSQHLTLTPKMRQTLQVLQLSTLELSQKINDALEDNPLLEICESSEEVSEGNTSEGDQELYWNAEGDDPEEWETPAEKHFQATFLNRPAACRFLKKIPAFCAGLSAVSTMTVFFRKV